MNGKMVRQIPEGCYQAVMRILEEEVKLGKAYGAYQILEQVPPTIIPSKPRAVPDSGSSEGEAGEA